MIATQKTFVGGMDMVSDDTQIQPNRYEWLINARTRFGRVAPIKRHVKDTTLPSGKYQGLIAVGNILVVFISGYGYYREDGSTVWVRLPAFQMDAQVDQYFTEKVPASYLQFVRNLNADGNIHSPIKVTTDFKISGTPAAIVVQDGINQPWLIMYDDANQIFTCRVTKNYDQWENTSDSTADREYVPIGKQMMYKDGILYIVAKDGKSVLRSITGRPLDFMVNVDTNGNKQGGGELAGGAATVSFAFDFNPITCIYPLDIPDSFIYGTSKTVRVVTADYNNTIFGEPTYRVAANIESGIVNQYSVMEILGDHIFIDYKHVKSFNAVQQLKFQGRNSIFSLALAKLLNQKKQRFPICIEFDNYALFNLDTNYGNVLAVYDILRQCWNSFDITEVIKIKQFAIVENVDNSKLYCITRYNELFQMFVPGTTSYLAQLKLRANVCDNTQTEHSSINLRPMFKGGTYEGTISVIEYVDDQASNVRRDGNNRISKSLPESVAGVPLPCVSPVIPWNKSRIDSPGFMLKDGLSGKKIAHILQWDTDAELVEITTETAEKSEYTSQKDKNKVMKDTYGSNS